MRRFPAFRAPSAFWWLVSQLRVVGTLEVDSSERSRIGGKTSKRNKIRPGLIMAKQQ